MYTLRSVLGTSFRLSRVVQALMLQRLTLRDLGWSCKLDHTGVAGRCSTPLSGFEVRFVGPVSLTLLSLLAPSTVRAQDRSLLQTTATVVSARPSLEALQAVHRLTRQQLERPDASEVQGQQLADIRVHRPRQPNDSAVVVSIEFLHN